MPVDIEEYNEYINNTPYYVLCIYGCLVNGEKAETISGTKIFFDSRLPDNKTVDVFKTEIKDTFRNGKDDEGETIDINKIQIEHVKAYPIRDYHAEKKSYLRIYTTTTFQKKIALNIILKHNLETTSDDRSAYYRKAAREYKILLFGWALLTNYSYNGAHYNARSPLYTHAFYVSINNFQTIYNPSTLHKTYTPSLITHDQALVVAWDIKTNSTHGLDSLPMARYKEDNVFMICMAINWKDNPKPLKQICLVDVDIISDPRWITIVCGNERNLLKAFALCWRALSSDIEFTYNGSKYDWPFVVERATN
nr:14903_t:CDS:1 [Entrophospora candida]